MPTNPAIPTLATGNVLSATQWNYLTALNGGVGLNGIANALVTTTTIPAAQTPSFQIQAGTIVGSPAAGMLTLTFPTAYTGGLLTVLGTPGDSSSSLAIVQVQGSWTKTSVVFGCFNTAGTAITTAVRVNWVAIGW